MTQLFNAISIRISLIFSLFTIIILMIMGIAVHQLVVQHFEVLDRTQLEGKVELIENLLQHNPDNNLSLLTQLDDALVGHHGLVVQIDRPSGQLLFSNTPTVIPSQPQSNPSSNSLLAWSIHQKNYQGLVVNQAANAEHTSHQIIVAIDTTAHLHFLVEFRQQLLIIGGGGTLSLMILGWIAAWRGLRPAQTMALVAEGISAQDLSGRLNIEKTPSELKSLAIAFNDMLDRLQTAVAKLSDFSSDIAHELRTPINNLMTQTQVSLSRPRDIATYKDVLFSNLEEFERLARMISDMLFLAKTQHGLGLPSKQKIDLQVEIHALFEFYDALAAEKGMTLHHQGEANIQGDPLMLRRAFSNLIANAIRYGKKDTVIYVICNQLNGLTSVSIQNQAPTISADQLKRLFDRFYRTDASRQRTDEGAGLGLAITKSIIEAHGATITVDSQNDTVTFTISFLSNHADGYQTR